MIAPLALALAATAAGTPPPAGLAISCAKVLTCAPEGRQVIDRAVVLVSEGRIEAVGRRDAIEVPEGYERVDLGPLWLVPGMVGLHSHVAASFLSNDLNDMVYLAQPGLRASAVVDPGYQALEDAAAGGVTTILYIPGSGVNVGGQGVLLKTAPERYERMLVRNPGSLKIAQSGNPEAWTVGVGRSFMNWHTRNTIERGRSYWKRWEAHEAGRGPEPLVDPQWEVFRDLFEKRTQISVHTQMYQVVLMTITMLRQEFGLDVYIDHGSIGAWRLGGIAQEAGVPAILGPRQADTPSRRFMSWADTSYEGFRGSAAGYWERGHRMIGFNTDAPIVPQEELSFQGAMAARFGLPDDELQVVRGLTIVPALAAGIADRVGSIEAGKDADLVAVEGHPADPRAAVRAVWIEGEKVFEASRARKW